MTIGCDGTDGVTKTNNIEALNVGSTLSIGTGVTTASGGANGTGTIARTTARIENASLLTLPVVGALVKFTAITVVTEDRYQRQRPHPLDRRHPVRRLEGGRAQPAGERVAQHPDRPAVWLCRAQRAEDPSGRQEGRHVGQWAADRHHRRQRSEPAGRQSDHPRPCRGHRTALSVFELAGPWRGACLRCGSVLLQATQAMIGAVVVY